MRRLLPLIETPGSHPGGRSALTCRFRCGDACFHEVPNTSDNTYVGDVIATALSRRSMMRAAAVVTVTTATGAAVVGTGAPEARAAAVAQASATAHTVDKAARGLRFNAVAPNTADAVTVPNGYGQNVVIRWGEPILRGAPPSTRSTRPPGRRRVSSATTTTSSPCCRCPASVDASFSWPTTSTPTRC